MYVNIKAKTDQKNFMCWLNPADPLGLSCPAAGCFTRPEKYAIFYAGMQGGGQKDRAFFRAAARGIKGAGAPDRGGSLRAEEKLGDFVPGTMRQPGKRCGRKKALQSLAQNRKNGNMVVFETKIRYNK